ncbi:Unknown protein, partial [Striga hermonthica]
TASHRPCTLVMPTSCSPRPSHTRAPSIQRPAFLSRATWSHQHLMCEPPSTPSTRTISPLVRPNRATTVLRFVIPFWCLVYYDNSNIYFCFYRQFLSLKQGTRSVDEYEREFTRLAAFVPDLVRTEAQRAQRFIDELYPAVCHNIVGHGTQTYARAVSIAQKVDASIRREVNLDRLQPVAPAQSSTAPPMPPATAQPPKNNKRKGKGAPMDKRTQRRLQQVPQCPTCGRLHRGECRFGQDICYYCHEPGHFANRCPKKAQQPQQPQQPHQQQQQP